MTINTIPRRTLLGLAAGLAMAQTAHALDLGLPKLEDLRPKWDSLGLGTTAETVVQVMGSPSGRTETQAMGVPHLLLEWKDIKGLHYSARFLAGRLYAKEMTDTR